MRSRGTSKSAVSRRFVAQTAAHLAAWQTASLEALDLVGLIIDGVHIGDHGLIVALGIACTAATFKASSARAVASSRCRLPAAVSFLAYSVMSSATI
jgi:hypothetical protein